MSAADIRRKLRAASYDPLPCNGKNPVPEAWQKRFETSDADIDIWSKLYPYARNTGILTRVVPALDLDIMNRDAADAAEGVVRDCFEEKGFILVRSGKRPKRAFLFRTDTPFKKIQVSLIAPNGDTDQKIEFLGDGQQIIVDGIHPETKGPYDWFGGKPGEIKRDDLPYIHEGEARTLVEEIVALLERDVGYKRAPVRPKKRQATGNSRDNSGPADWAFLIENIYAGRELHDSLRDLAAKLIASGMAAGAAVNFLRGALDKSTVPQDDDRWQARYAEIPHLVDTAVEKKEQREKPPAQSFSPWTISQTLEVFER